MTPASLADFFRPRNIALVGASDRSAWSRSIVQRFAEYGHDGALFAVNRDGRPAHGLPGHASIADIAAPVDTAFLYVPADAVAGALRDAAAAGIRNAVILSSGFAEAGAAGVALQAELLAVAAAHDIRLLGPNSLGFVNLAQRSCCTALRSRLPVRDGSLAIVSQSGAVANDLMKWAHAQGIGLSFVCATGNEAHIGVADVVDHLVDDPATAAIAVYVEGIGDPARFVATARRARAARKPLVLLKVGRSEVSRAVAQAHTGALVGDDAVFDAICRRHAITRTSSIEELIATADFLGRCGPIDPPRVGMASVSGGACGMYADLAHQHGLAVPPWTPATQDALRALLPPFAATLNPLDTTGVLVQDPRPWADIVPALARDPGIGLAVIAYTMVNTPIEDGIVGPSFAAIAEGFARAGRPPVIVSLCMHDRSDTQADVCARLGIDMVLPNLDIGVRALAHLQRWSEALAQPDAPAPAAGGASVDRPVGERAVLAHLARHGVPVIPAVTARDARAAVAAARAAGGPVALKIAAPDLAHKTEAGGVLLGIAGDAAVRAGFDRIVAAVAAHVPGARIDGVLVSPMRQDGIELIVGVARDPLWGPVIVVGLGGILTEVLRDSQLRPLPITAGDARAMIAGLRGARLLDGFRGAPAADVARVAQAIVAIGDAALALGPSLAALEVNPLWVRGAAVEALDALAMFDDAASAGTSEGARI